MKNVVRDLRMGTALVGAARRMGAVLGLALFGALASPALAEPLRIEINNPVIEAMPFAIPDFQAESSGAGAYGADIARVVAADLSGTGLFREIPASAFVSNVSDFNAPVDYANWRAVNAQALIKGSVSTGAGGALTVKFRLFDVPSGQQMGTGLQFSGTVDGLRRMGHKVADWVYQQITGEGPYFDSRVAFVSVSGPKNARLKRLAIMDYDGANVSYLTGSDALVLTPRFSPAGDRVLYTSYETGQPQIFALDVATAGRKALGNAGGNMAFSPRFAPDARSLVFSVEQGGNSDIYSMDTNGGSLRRLTDAPSIETAPSYAPDGSRIVFESDRSGTQQLYIMSAAGGEAQRISFGPGRYGTPVWSPRGDFIAFTKQNEGRFHIGVMRTDGSDERLLTSSFLDEGPTWSPNGRVIMFTRETQGASGGPSLFSVDITGRNLRKMPTPGFASSPAWSPLKP